MKTDNAATIAATALLAACFTTIAHEAVGHGNACVISGGRVTLLTSAHFECTPSPGRLPLPRPPGDPCGYGQNGPTALAD